MRCITAFPHIGLQDYLKPVTEDNFTHLNRRREAICTMVRVNNAKRLREIQRTIIEDNDVFENIHTVSISTIDRVCIETR